MAYEVYIPRAIKRDYVTLTKHHIRLGSNLVAKLDGDKVEVAFDSKNKKMRIRGVNGKGLTYTNNKIVASGIFRYFGINQKGVFDTNFDEEENAIIVNLNISSNS